jgi:hypothetical protein
MAGLSERIRKSVGRHFVTLSCVHTHPTQDEERVLLYSGYVVEIAGEWFYFTAGHILRNLRTAIDAGSEFDVWRLGDQTAGHNFRNTGVPYAFDIDQWFVLEDNSLGLDYATVHLSGLYRRQLEVGGVIPFHLDAWSDHTVPHDRWALIGVPTESVGYDGKTLITARIVVAPLTAANAPPTAGSKAENQFYAKLDDDPDGVVKDLVGMSGGPVVMVRNTDEGWKYSIIGVQSSWYPRLRIIAACPVRSFVDALRPIVEEALTSVVFKAVRTMRHQRGLRANAEVSGAQAHKCTQCANAVERPSRLRRPRLRRVTPKLAVSS